MTARTAVEPATMSAQEAADRIGITTWAFYYAVKSGNLPTVQNGGPIIRLGEKILVNRERLESWLEGGVR